MRKMYLIILFMVFAAGLKAQNITNYVQAVDGSLAFNAVVWISVSSGSTIPHFSTLSLYASGISVNNYATVQIKSTVPWYASVKSTSANFTPMTTGGISTMPCSILGIRKTGTSTFATMSTSNLTLSTGSAGSTTTSGNTFNVDMRFNPGLLPGGTYMINLLYTVTQL